MPVSGGQYELIDEHQNPYGGTCPAFCGFVVSPRRALCIECGARVKRLPLEPLETPQ